MEDSEADVVLEEGQRRRRRAQFQVIDEQCSAAQGKAGHGITRSGLIQSKSPMCVSTSGEESFGQRKTGRLVSLRLRTGASGLRHESVSEGKFHSDPSGACQNKF